MLSVRNRVSVACWLVAGVPIVATLVQAVLAAMGVVAVELPVLGPVARALRSLAVLNEAALIFSRSTSLVFVLFVLVAVAWAAEGVSMLHFEQRQWTYGAAGFVTLFLVLFALVYLPLLSAGVPVAQLALFALVPVLTLACTWVAPVRYDWAEDVDAAVEAILDEARQAAREARQTFDSGVETRFDESSLDTIRGAVPEAAVEAEERIESFRADCEAVLDDVESLAAGRGDRTTEQRLQAARDLRADAEALDAAAELDAVRESLGEAVASACYDRFGDLHLVSRYGDAYAVRNVPEYRELSLPSIDAGTVPVGGEHGSLADELAAAARGDASVGALATALERADDHVSALEAHLDEQEAAFAERRSAAERTVETAEEQVAALDGAVGSRLSELLLEGRYEDPDSPPGPDATVVEDHLRRGTEALHDCDFDRALELAERARETAERLVAIAEFFDGVAATVDAEGGSVPLASAVSPEFAERMRVPFEQTYGVEYAVADDRIELGYGEAVVDVDDGVDDEQGDPTEWASDDGDGETTDEVLYVLRELKSAADTSSAANTVEYQTDTLPDHIARPAVFDRLERFSSGQPDIEAVELGEDPQRGYVSITIDGDRSPQAVMDRLHERFRETAGRN